MSATNQTTNLHLPLFVGSDKPAWLVDFNGAMNSIDTAVGTNTTDISGLDAQVTAMGSTVESLNTTVTGHTASIIALNTATSHNAGDISTINSLIGNGTPTTSDKTLIGAINELDAKDGNLSDLITTHKNNLVAAINEAAQGSGAAASGVSYDNSQSGLTADDVQEAIDELAAGAAGHNYSTTEHPTGETWVDGSPVYEKTISIGSLPNATSKTVAHGITGLANVISMGGTAAGTGTSAGTFLSLPFIDTSNLNNQIAIYVSGANVAVSCGSDRSAYTAYLTVKYTKSA